MRFEFPRKQDWFYGGSSECSKILEILIENEPKCLKENKR